LERILDCYLVDYIDTEIKEVTADEIEHLESILEPLFVFAVAWSFGCTTDLEGRTKFDRKLRTMMKDSMFGFPDKGHVYDYTFDQDKKEWVTWDTTVPKFVCDSSVSYNEICVPTFDSIRMKYLKRLLLTNGKHVLCPGPTGTGKTVNINELLMNELPEEYQTISLTFSAQTSANQTQDALDEKFEKRRKGVYGPSPGKKFVVFVDDLNMPKKEEFGAQPPIELIRQWFDHKGWYDRQSKEKTFMKIEDIIFVAAMGPPGGGRSKVTGRLQRHFNYITYTDLQEDSIKMIFNTIVDAFLSDFCVEVTTNVTNLVDMTLKIYKTVMDNLKPIPSKSHYTFNLRDISKIFQGFCAADKKSADDLTSIAKLWIHENNRVFGDRLINNIDRHLLADWLKDGVMVTLKLDEAKVYENARILFGDFMDGIEMENRQYKEITDLKIMQTKIEEYLEEHNAGTKHPMKLIMFLDACDHIARICRIL
jgi:dynein heavy chain